MGRFLKSVGILFLLLLAGVSFITLWLGGQALKVISIFRDSDKTASKFENPKNFDLIHKASADVGEDIERECEEDTCPGECDS